MLENTQVKEFVETPTESEGCTIGGNSCTPMTISLKDADGNDAGVIYPEIYMAATGRKPVTRGTSLGLEEAGLTLHDSGHIAVDETYATSDAAVFAAGDCIKGPSLASTGVDQAQRAVANAFGATNQDAASDFPIGMWTTPEVGYYGLTLAQALEKGFDADEGIATYDMCLRGRVFAPDGMLKLVFDRDSKRLLGVHIIGTDACEMVHYGMNLIEKK